MKLRETYLLITSLFIPINGICEPVKLCTDESYWYPFTMVQKNKPTGIHVDIAKIALENLGYENEFRAMPWKRCLKEAENGNIDIVVSASYKPERAEYLYFPKNAENETKSAMRIMQIEYSVVTLKSQNYRYSGDITTIPTPIRIPAGYSLASEFKKEGLRVDDAAMSDTANVSKLLRDKNGSVIVIPELASLLNARIGTKNKLVISEETISSKSYFLPVSRKSKLTETEIEAIWRRIAELRENKSLMADLTAKY